MADSASQITSFMNAIKTIESGGRYGIVGPQTRYGLPRGAYQILDSNWRSWSSAAGIAGADWRDPAAQDRVARHIMSRYFSKYQSWDLVAVAWFAGPGRADEAMSKGINSLSSMKDILGTSVPGYVKKMRANFSEAPTSEPLAMAALEGAVSQNRPETLRRIIGSTDSTFGSSGGLTPAGVLFPQLLAQVSRGIAGGAPALPPSDGLTDPEPFGYSGGSFDEPVAGGDSPRVNPEISELDDKKVQAGAQTQPSQSGVLE